MADDERQSDDAIQAALADLGRKLDTVAGAVATIAGGHRDLLAHVAEAEARRGQDSLGVSQRLEALERQVLGLSQVGDRPVGELAAPARTEVDLAPIEGQVANLATAATQHRDDLALSLEVLARVADAVDRLDARTEDRLASVRDAAMAPIADLEAVLTARSERTEARFNEVSTTLQELADRPAEAGAFAPLLERVEELATAVQSITWQLPELGDDVTGRLTEHTDAALIGVLRLIDDRLATLRRALLDVAPAPPTAVAGFEAGAVMGAAQAAWNRLEQRLDTEFDDLGRQLQAMASLIEGVVTSTEGLANRPVVSGDQLRRAASTVRDTVVSAGRSRRDRRGGARGLGSGD